MAKQFPHPFGKLLKDFLAYKNKLAMKVSGIAEREFKENFTRQGYRGDGGGVVKWAGRHYSSFKAAKSRRGRAILIKRGRLRRGFKKRPDANTARVINDVPYAQAHNEGSTQRVKVRSSKRRRGKKVFRVKAYTRKNNLPARPFMITTQPLLNDIERAVLNDVTKIYNSIK